ncbi:MAG: transposase [Lachnospiraceae bacterium]|nr:transposase [Lachnospiraceae bacterium]
MARKSSIPEEILKYRPAPSTKVRNDNGIYHVYKYSAKKLKSGKWGTNSGYLIGKIVPGEGFVANKRYLQELADEKKVEYSNEITDVQYGKYALLISLSQEKVLENLKKCFITERAYQIYAYGLILCANGFIHVDQINDCYLDSYLSLLYSKFSFKMGYTALSNLLTEIGRQGNPRNKFEQLMIDESTKNIALDGHVIKSYSWNNCFAEPGYKMKSLKAPQINIIMAYDIKAKQPLAYQTFRGSSVDKKSCKDFFKGRTFTNTKFFVDRGFNTKDLLDIMSSNGNTYATPVRSNDKDYTRIKETLEFDNEFIYKPSKKETAHILYHDEQLDNDVRIIVYKDIDENNSTIKNYLTMLDLGENGYTQEILEEKRDWWGVYVLKTNMKESAKEIFEGYKDRWLIETYNNYVKNDADFNHLKTQDYYTARGLDFIMLVTGIIHSTLNEAVLSLNKSSISNSDILRKAGHLRMVKNGKKWELRNDRTKDIKLLEQMGFTPLLEYPSKSAVS